MFFFFIRTSLNLIGNHARKKVRFKKFEHFKAISKLVIIQNCSLKSIFDFKERAQSKYEGPGLKILFY